MNHKVKQTFISLFVAVAVSLIGIGIIVPILPLYADTFAAKGISIGLVFSAFSLSRALLGGIIGRFSDRVGRKRILMIGLLGYTVVSLLYVLAMNLWQLGIFRLFQGAAAVMVTPIAQAYIADISPPQKEGRYMSLFYTSMFLGMALGPLLGGSLTEAWSYQAAFYAMAGLSSLALLLVAGYVPNDRKPVSPTEGQSEPIMPLRDVVKNQGVQAILVYVATRGFWRQGFNAFYPLFAATAAGLGASTIGAVITSYMLASAILQIPFGILADRLPKFPQVVIGSTIPPLLLVFIPFTHSLRAVLVITFLIGALSALSRASVLAIRTELGHDHGMGTMTGLHTGAFATGQMLGPPAFGAFADLFGLSTVFPFGSSIGLLGTGFVISKLRSWRNNAAATG